MCAIAVFQVFDGTSLFSVSSGPVEIEGGHAGFHMEQVMTRRGNPPPGRRWDPAQVTLLGDTGGTQPRCPHSPARAPALPAPLIRQPGANADDTPDSPSPSSLGANTSCFLVSWIPHQGHKAEKRSHRANREQCQLNSSCRPREH